MIQKLHSRFFWAFIILILTSFSSIYSKNTEEKDLTSSHILDGQLIFLLHMMIGAENIAAVKMNVTISFSLTILTCKQQSKHLLWMNQERIYFIENFMENPSLDKRLTLNLFLTFLLPLTSPLVRCMLQMSSS
jgi:hypothetical protein